MGNDVIAFCFFLIMSVTSIWGFYVALSARDETGSWFPRRTMTWRLAGFLIFTDSTIYALVALSASGILEIPTWLGVCFSLFAAYWPVDAFILWAREKGRPREYGRS